MSYDNDFFDPAENALPVPSVLPNEDVRYSIVISEGWKYVLMTVLNRLLLPGAWQGDVAAQRDAVSQTVQLINQIYTAAPVDCSGVADCIDTSPDVIVSIENTVVNSTEIENNFIQIVETNTTIQNFLNETINNYIFNIDNPVRCCEGGVIGEPEAGGDLIPEAAINGCDNDALFGAAVNLVDEFANAMGQLFDELNLASNTLTLAEIIFDFLEVPPFTFLSGLAEFLLFLQEVGEEVWLVADNSANRTRLACLLFCAFQANCEVNINVVKEAVFTEWENEVGVDLRTARNFADFITSLPTNVTQWAQWVLFLGMFTYTVGGTVFVRRVLFINPSRSISWWSDRLKLGYLNPNPAWTVDCDDCPDENCGFYVINFNDLGIAGLPNGWESSPPSFFPNELNNTVTRWANEREENETLRPFNYPTYGVPDGDFVAVSGAYGMGDAPCTLRNVVADGTWPITANTKAISVYALSGYDWNARTFLGDLSVPEGNVAPPPNFTWNGEIQNVTHVLIVVRATRGNDVVNGATIRFLRINQGL